MNPHAAQEELALYAAGDLDDRTALRITRHVRDCEVCAASVVAFQAAREMLAAAAEQPSSTDLLEVRQRVMGRIGLEPVRRFGWAWALAASFGVLIVAFWMTSVTQVPPVIRPPANPLPPLAQIPTPELAIPEIRVRRRPSQDRPGIRRVALMRDTKGQSIIRLQTADPNVVILLQGERTEAE